MTIITLQLNNQIFKTTKDTLLYNGQENYFSELLTNFQTTSNPQTASNTYFIDRNPEVFSEILDILRGYDIPYNPTLYHKIYQDLIFYKLFSLADKYKIKHYPPLTDHEIISLTACLMGH